LILLSDGRANVPLRQGDPWHEALEGARQLNCRSLVIDTESRESPLDRVSDLASALRAPSMPLANIETIDILTIK
jgi:magnesium chelatase subunit D